MKKSLLLATATAMLTMTACVSEDLDLNKTQSDKGYIALNVSSDQEFTTRASQDAPADWTVVLGGQDNENTTVGELASKSLAAGDYTIKVYNYADEAAAHADNSNYGAAYYTGDLGITDVNKKVTVTSGQTTKVTLDMGKAKNAKLTIESSAPASAAITITATSKANNSRALTFTKAADATTFDHSEAFFPAADEITVAATYNGVTLSAEDAIAKKLTLGAAATNNKIIISTNGNGKISFTTITYDDEFTNGNTQTIEFDAATGAALTVTNSKD